MGLNANIYRLVICPMSHPSNGPYAHSGCERGHLRRYLRRWMLLVNILRVTLATGTLAITTTTTTRMNGLRRLLEHRQGLAARMRHQLLRYRENLLIPSRLKMLGGGGEQRQDVEWLWSPVPQVDFTWTCHYSTWLNPHDRRLSAR